jgi:hypothetical protein
MDPVNPFIYAGTDYGVFKSIDYGASWYGINNGITNPAVLSLAIDPRNTNIIYAGTVTEVFKTTNAGESWATTNLTTFMTMALAIDPNNSDIVYAGTWFGIFRSADGGQNWDLKNNFSFNCVAINPSDSNTILGGTPGGGIFKSIDGGDNWQPINNGLDNLIIGALSIAPLNTNVLYAGTERGFFRSINGGDNWVAVNSGLDVYSLVLHSNDSNTVYIGAVGGVFKFQFDLSEPDINIKQSQTNIPDETGSYDFGSVNLGASKPVTFTIENLGTADLQVTGSQRVLIGGPHAYDFFVTSDPISPISANGSTTFVITFTPGGLGPRSATVTIENDDPDENPYNFVIRGTGNDNTPPLPPTNLQIVGGGITLAWDANTEADLAGYRLYFWKSTEQPYSHHIDVRQTVTPATPTYRLIGLNRGETYCFAVTAYDNFRNESGYSNGPTDVCGIPGPTGYVNPFADIPLGYWAEDYILTIYYDGITLGCTSGMYCPHSPVTRDQMASFIVRAVDGGNAATCLGNVFNDVTAANPHCANIERLRNLNITQGCGGGNYCPGNHVTRAEMASFLVRAADGADATVCLGTLLNDVPPGAPHCANIERLLDLGVTQGCAPGIYCPGNNVLRDQMAAFITRAFIGIP